MENKKVKIQVPKCELTFYMRKERANNIDNVLKRIKSHRPFADLHNIEIKISEY